MWLINLTISLFSISKVRAVNQLLIKNACQDLKYLM